ncbi:Calcofluor white hypersensitive protein [Mycena kentingensis (nom. inval.)]|nr:Calcofluor white hypersensitive protein [Mycena kentingensis (nom. inval.)]
MMLTAERVARVHTALSATAFATALALALLLHYKRVVKNSVASFPDEYWPSVSATVGDWFPERNIFQILIAFTSGPRLAVCFIQYIVHSKRSSTQWPTVILVFGLIRTVCCGGWVYVTSSSNDNHDVHDFFMSEARARLFSSAEDQQSHTCAMCNIPWMVGCSQLAAPQTRQRRILVAAGFFLSLPPLVYFYIRHAVDRVPGAYSRYSILEWSLIVFDIFFDSIAADEFSDLQIVLTDISGNVPRCNSAPIAEKVLDRTPRCSSSRAKIVSRCGLYQDPSSNLLASVGVILRFHIFVVHILVDFHASTQATIDELELIQPRSLIPTLFYFSVWELGIAGNELALLSVLSPLLLVNRHIRVWASSRSGSTILHGLSLVGLCAFVLEKPVHRLLLVTFASAAAMMKEANAWAIAKDDMDQYVVTGLGFLLSALSKYANHSNNPVWPSVNSESGGYNTLGLFLAILSLYQHYVSSPRPLQAPTPSSPATHWLGSAASVGGLIFALHSLLSDGSTLVAWSWTGYTNGQPNGPLPHLHTPITLLAMSLGLFISLLSLELLAHPYFFAYGCVSVSVMYSSRNWDGYFAGLNVAVFLMSIVPMVLWRASTAAGPNNEHSGKVFFTAMVVYCLLGLASVWTVAYAFVPGGVYLRERTDIVLALQMACLAPAFEWPGFRHRPSTAGRKTANLSYSRICLAIFSLTSFLVSTYRTPSGSPQPFKPGPRMFNAGIWTVHFGMDNTGRDSQRLVRDVVRDMQLDIIGLLETDLHRISFGNRDLTRVLIEEMGYYVDTGPGPASHTWGAAILSKFPIINSTHHLLPSPNGELAPAIEAVLDIWGTPVTVVVAHNGQEEDPLDRELQSIELARIMAATYPRPVLFLGYVVTKPLAPRPNPYQILVEDGKVFDIDKDDWDRWCEYIFYRGMYRTSYARLSRGKVTDTELQIGQFVLPPHGQAVVDDSEKARYLRSWKEQLPEDHWFTMEYFEANYYNKEHHKPGKHGHYYHVFGTPLYYRIPNATVSS